MFVLPIRHGQFFPRTLWLWTSLGIDGCFSAYTLEVSTWHWLFILLKFSHVWACLVSWRWCLREFNSNEVFGFEWLKIKEAVVVVNARGREWGQEGTLRVMMAKWTCCHFSGLLSTTKHATLGEFSTSLAAMTLGYNIGPSKHIYQKGTESLQRNKCHLGSTLERQTAGNSSCWREGWLRSHTSQGWTPAVSLWPAEASEQFLADQFLSAILGIYPGGGASQSGFWPPGIFCIH